jgi:NTP pyrophosphatase (non-canonical NTP hydrolase)
MAMSAVLAGYIDGTVNRCDATAHCHPAVRFNHGVMGIISEVYEIEEAIGPVLNGEMDGSNFIEEAGDVLFYFCLLADNLVRNCAPELDPLEMMGHFVYKATVAYEDALEKVNKYDAKKRVVVLSHQLYRSASKLADASKRIEFYRGGNFSNIAAVFVGEADRDKAIDQMSVLMTHAASMLAVSIRMAATFNPNIEVTVESVAKANSEKLRKRYPGKFSLKDCEGRDTAAEAKLFNPGNN